jgi:PAS domain S-box-containing protein
LFEQLLAILLRLSESEYGFIGETLSDEDGKPFLRTYSITNIAWNEETQRFYDENVRKGLEFRNLETLFGAVMLTEEPVISNDPATDPRRGGLPSGHPSLDTFLGIPLFSDGAMVGMLGVANRDGGYDEEFIQALDPLLKTCANAIFAFRADRERRSAEARLHEEQARVKAMLDGVFDGIVTIDERGVLQSMNAAAERIFGFGPDEIIGRSIAQLIPEPFRSRSGELISKFVETGEPDILGTNRELPACRKNGEVFPAQIRVTEVFVNERRHFTGIVRDLSVQHATEERVEKLTAKLEQSHYGQMVGRSEAMRNLYRTIEEVAAGPWPVLIEGETGVGKELVARAIHAAGSPRGRPFVPTNIAGLTDSLASSQLFGHRRGAFTGALRDQKGLFEAADGGTLFLDEVGDVSEFVQTSLLRVLQEGEIVRLGDSVPRKVNVRIICATNGSLRERLEKGQFRKDLLFRLQVARIAVPPLRARREDIPLLIESFLAEARVETGRGLTGFTRDAMKRLERYEWPGNVRELRNAIDYVTIHCRQAIASAGDLPVEIASVETGPPLPNPRIPVADIEKDALLAALKECAGNRSQAARSLGISRATLYRRLQTYGVS